MQQRGVMWWYWRYLLRCLGSFTGVYLIWRRKKLCPYGCLIPCTAYYTFRKLKQSSWSQRPSANFLWKTAHFSCLPLSCWFETFSECSELEHCVCTFFFVYVCVDLSVYVCMCWEFVDKHLGQAAFCNHMMTAPDEVTVNSEPLLIITCVCFRIFLTRSQSPLLFFSHYFCDTSEYGQLVKAHQCGLMSRAPEHKVTAPDSLKTGPDLPPNC